MPSPPGRHCGDRWGVTATTLPGAGPDAARRRAVELWSWVLAQNGRAPAGPPTVVSSHRRDGARVVHVDGRAGRAGRSGRLAPTVGPVTDHQVVRGDEAHPASDEGRALFARLLGAADPALVRTFPVDVPAGTQLGRHWHTATLAARVLGGSIGFAFGAAAEERHDLGPGDWVAIGAAVRHDEWSTDGASMVVAHLEPFETFPHPLP